jgi:hypothetical protein
VHLKRQRFILSNLYHSSLLVFCSNHCFTAFVQMRLKKNGKKKKKKRLKFSCWQFDFIHINESKLIFANAFIYSYCNIVFLIFLYFIPFIIYYMSFHLYLNSHTIFILIRIYVLSIFGMIKGLSIPFLNSKI